MFRVMSREPRVADTEPITSACVEDFEGQIKANRALPYYSENT